MYYMFLRDPFLLVLIIFFICANVFSEAQWNLVKNDDKSIILSGPCAEISEKISFIRHESNRAGMYLGQFPKIEKLDKGVCSSNIQESISPKFFNSVKNKKLIDYRPKISLLRNSDNRLILSGDTCDEVLEEATNFKLWKARLEGKDDLVVKGQIKIQQGCKIDVTDDIPKFILQYHDTNSIYNGPNCFNFALVVAGLLPGLKPTSNEEFDVFINSPLCQRVHNKNLLRAGDIGVYSSKNSKTDATVFNHGFIYISDKLVLSKNDQSVRAPYSVQETQAMYNQQYEDPNFFTEYYRCMSFDEFIANKGQEISKDILDLNKTIDEFECNFSNLFFNRSLSKMAMKNMIDTYAILQSLLVKEKDKLRKNINSATDSNLVVLNQIEQRLNTFKKYYLEGIRWRVQQKNFKYDPRFNVQIVEYGYDPSKGKAIIVLPTLPPLQIPYKIMK